MGRHVKNPELTQGSTIEIPSVTTAQRPGGKNGQIIYNKTAAGGGTGLFFINSAVKSGTEDELISKSKATALAIALG